MSFEPADLDDASRAVVESAVTDLPVNQMSLTDARQYMVDGLAMFDERPMERAFTTSCPSGDHEVPLRVLVPEDAGHSVVVYFHGGGWVLGSAELFESFCRELAFRSKSAVVVVDYRLAPEHHFPAAVEDCYAAVLWAGDQLTEIAPRASQLVVAGDSAGGNLAAVMAQQSFDRGGPDIALQAMLYPVTDSQLDTESYLDPEIQLLLRRETMAWFWECYVPDLEARHDPRAAPLRREDLSGLPPAFVITAQYDVLRDEGVAYAERLKAANVDVVHEHHADQMHGFAIDPALPGHDRALSQLSDAIVSAGS